MEQTVVMGSQGQTPFPTSGKPFPSDLKGKSEAMEFCRPYLMWVARGAIPPRLRSKAAASDLVQETFLEAHRDIRRFRGRSELELRLWLRRILLHNLGSFMQRYTRSRKRQVAREIPLDEDETIGRAAIEVIASTLSPSGKAVRREDERAVREALKFLNDRERRVLQLRCYESLSWEDIGRQLGGSAGMAMKLCKRALARLRVELARQRPARPRERPRRFGGGPRLSPPSGNL